MDYKVPLEIPQTLGGHLLRVIRITQEQGSVDNVLGFGFLVIISIYRSILHEYLRATTGRSSSNDRSPHFPVVDEIIENTRQLVRKSWNIILQYTVVVIIVVLKPKQNFSHQILQEKLQIRNQK
jgi:hypothetical protein